jgi:hypothetical protein
MAAVIVVCIVSVVDSEADRCEIDGGLNSLADDPRALAPGDGNALCKDDVEKVDSGDNPAAVGVDRRLSSFEDEGLEDRMQEANAAKWSGKQPCRDSLVPAASGYIWTSNKMNLHTSINGSSVE